MNVIREIERINQTELDAGIHGGMKGSWHDKYKDSAWVYIGGMSYELSEGDIICFMSQWGEIEDINLIRDRATNKSLGYAFLKYEDQRSTILAVDNFNGIKLLGRVLRCDHVERYKLPKEVREREENKLENNPSAEVSLGPGHAYNKDDLANEYSISKGLDLWKPLSSQNNDDDSQHKKKSKNKHKDKDSKHKKHKKYKKEKHEKHEKNKYETNDYHSSDDDLLEYNPNEDIKRIQPNRSINIAPEDLNSNSAPKFSSLQPVADAARSWRGNKDPELEMALAAEKKRIENADQTGYKRKEFEGMAGVNRTR